MKKIYRVCVFKEEYAGYEAINYPGGRFGATGFWTTSFEDAENLYKKREYEVANVYNGPTYSRIISTTIDNVVLEKNHVQYKDGHDKEIDKNEIFVSGILDPSKVSLVGVHREDPEEIKELNEMLRRN